VQGGLHATGIHRRRGDRRALQSAVAIGKQQHGVAMDLPEAAQELMGRLRQRHETILVALGVADVHPLTGRIDIPHLKPQPFAEAQSQAIKREEKHPVTEQVGGGE
jgi:hypothetical protein